MTDEAGLSRRGFLRTAAGATATAGAAGTATAQEGTSSGGAGKSVVVGPGGSLTFEPAEIKVTPGTTVKWDWDSDGHNIVVGDQPEGGNWEGTAGGASKLYDTGHTYSHTFETKGTYEYWCEPHKTAGMVGSVEVVDSISTPAASGPAVPDSAKTLGLATTFAMVATLGLAFFFLKYGGNYETPDE